MRTVLHSDLNNFYASCECLHQPEYWDIPLVVSGKVEDRHGIVLAKNQVAKNYGIKTGEVLFEARKKCPNLKAVEANFGLYRKYSKLVKNIYLEYTDRVESFGIDESWLDVTGCIGIFGSGEAIAYEIKERIKNEIGLTVSIGVSYNKIFAKLGSDIKKPDAVTVIDRKNYKKMVWSLPVEELLFVGRATKKKLESVGIQTIGDLANTDQNFLRKKLGKWGDYLHRFANGNDDSIVKKATEHDEVKSIGNSLTFYRDLKTEADVEALVYLLSESVAARMKDYGVGVANVVRLSIVDNSLNSFSRQQKLPNATSNSGVIASTAMQLFRNNFDWSQFVRGVGVSVCDFSDKRQVLFCFEEEKRQKSTELERAVEGLRGRFGRGCINRAIVFRDKRFLELNIKEDHTIHPVSYL